MPIIAREKQRLADDALVGPGQGAQRHDVPGAEDVREGAADGAGAGSADEVRGMEIWVADGAAI